MVRACKCLAETGINGKPQRAKCNAEIREFTIRFILFTEHYEALYTHSQAVVSTLKYFATRK